MPAITNHQGTVEALEQRPGAYAWYALGLLTLVYVLNFLDRTLIYILFTPIKKEMAFSDLQLALLGTTSFVIFYTALGIPFGRLSDRVVRETVSTIASDVAERLVLAPGGLALLVELEQGEERDGHGHAIGAADGVVERARAAAQERAQVREALGHGDAVQQRGLAVGRPVDDVHPVHEVGERARAEHVVGEARARALVGRDDELGKLRPRILLG